MWRSLFRNKRTRSLRLEVRDPAGMHLRPAAQLSHEAKGFRAALRLCKEGACADMRDVHALLSLGIAHGDRVTVYAEGDDAKRALEAIAALWERLNPQTPHDEPSSSETSEELRRYEGARIEGECIRQGIAVGVPYAIDAPSDARAYDDRTFTQSLQHVLTDLRQSDHPIFQAQAALLESLMPCDDWDAFHDAVRTRINELQGTAMEAKIDDYRDLIARLQAAMSDTSVAFPAEPFILFAERPLPSLIATLPPHTQGVVLAGTSPASHTALLLRGGTVPAIVLDVLPRPIPTYPVILDAAASTVVLEPSPNDIATANSALEANKKERQKAYAKRFEPVLYRNEQVRILANVGSLEEADSAQAQGAEGIGLLRTEFLFTETLPDVTEQTAIYRAFAERFEDITVRLLDIGGDKPAAYLTIPQEHNPFLGERGIRLLARFPELFAGQLEALYCAFEGKDLKIMFPMIATPQEFREAKRFALEVADKGGFRTDRIAFGMMVEVPSVLFDIKRFNASVDFYSIGTNDLTQYLYAIERTHPTLRVTDNTALMHALSYIVTQTTKPVSLCGELSADLAKTEALLRLGLRTFSVAPLTVPELKERIRRV